MAFWASGEAASRAVMLVLMLSAGLSTACGSDDGEKAPVERSCEPSAEDLLPDAFAFEREILIRGRADAAFEEALGEDSARLLDDADIQLSELIQQAATELGIELPDPGAVSECPATAGVARESLSVPVNTAFGMTAKALADSAHEVPKDGTDAERPFVQTAMGVAADGSPTTTVTTFNYTKTMRGSTVTVTIGVTIEITNGDVTTTESATVGGFIDVCPDSGGISRGNITFVADGVVGGASYHANSYQYFDIIVNDQALVASTEVTSTFTYRATGGPRETNVTGSGSGSTTGESNSVNIGDVRFEYNVGDLAASQAVLERNIVSFGFSAAALVRPEAQRKWRGGTCILVEADPESAMVYKDSQLQITAKPKQKFDLSDVDATVVATLSGVKSLDKQGQRVPPLATYNYVAGSEFKDQGVIKFKSTSKRGIGEGTATITVKCDETMECPEGKTLNVDACVCECTTMRDCPDGQVWDPEECQCVCEPENCLMGKRWDTELCECVCDRVCPEGQALNLANCMCEPTCEIDPTVGNALPEECMWVGTINVTMAEGGSAEFPNIEYQRTVTWNTSYDASFTVEDPVSFTGQLFINGSIGGSWENVDENVYPAPDSCVITTSESATVSGEPNHDNAFAAIVPKGDGTFDLLGGFYSPDLELIGTVTSTDTCGGDYTGAFGIALGGFMGNGTPSRDAFTGSSDFESPSFEYVDDEFATFHVSWNLHLVRR